MDCSISREQLVGELREYSQTLELVSNVKSAPIAAAQAREELPLVLAFLAHLQAAQAPTTAKVSGAKKSAPRCAWYRDIRRAYAIAREAGLDVKADEAMRAAFGRLLGRRIETREEMNGADWIAVGDAMKARVLAW